MINIPEFESKKELFDFLVTNKKTLIAQKKAEMKRADAIVFQPMFIVKKDNVDKASAITGEVLSDDILVMVAINTTNIFDSHHDVHIPSLWSKSLAENKNIMHLQEHSMTFKDIIADGKDVRAYTKTMSFAELGFDFPGECEVLVFESLVKKDRNPYMNDQYRKGYVRNHSAGMIYVKLVLCINDENYGAEYEAWQKYYPIVANKSELDEVGFFWAVKEAKVVEGSAVPRGSNYVTPTISVGEPKSEPEKSTRKIEPSKDTHTEPEKFTQKINYGYLIENFKLN